MTDFRSSDQAKPFKSTSSQTGLSVTAEARPFRAFIPVEKKFKVEELFNFRRGRADLLFSVLVALLALFLLLNFGSEGGWEHRDLPQKRFGKILKQPWIGPAAALVILVPSTLLNLYMSWRRTRLDRKLQRPNKTLYEVTEWAKGLEFLAYFIVYTFSIEVVGYLISTVFFGVALTYRLGYRSLRWIAISAATGFTIVLFFRTFLQIKTPVNIWLYNQLPDALGNFMKVYF